MLKNFLAITYRTLFKNKTYFLLGTLGLSLGISCVIALYTIVHFQDSFDNHQESYNDIYRVVGSFRSEDETEKTSTVPHPLGNMLREEVSGIEAVSNLFLLSDQINIPLSDDRTKKIKQGNIAFVQDDLFDILTIDWLYGGVTDNENATYLSETTAKKFFGNTIDLTTVLGKTIILGNTHTLIVTGIYQDFPKKTDFPFQVINHYSKQEGINPYFGEGKMWARLNGQTQCILKINKNSAPEQIEKRMATAFDKFNQVENYKLHLQPLAKIHTEPISNYSGISFEPKYKVISYTLAFFLALIGSINFINLSTARAVSRSKEVGIRKVLGGTRSNLIFQFIFETFTIVAIATAIGFFVSAQLLAMFSSLMNTPVTLEDVPTIDWIVFSSVILVSMTFLSGLYPAVLLSSFKPIKALKIRISNVDRQTKFPLRKLLVGLQFSFSIFLIVGAVILFAQMNYMRSYDMGFTSDGILQLMFPKNDFEKQKQLKLALDQLPEIEQVSIHLGSPLANINNTGKYFSPIKGKEDQHVMNVKNIDENYLDLFDLTLISGRNITPNDPYENIIITEKALTVFDLGSADEALGKELQTIWGDKKKIIGVINDFHVNSLQYATMPVSLSYYPKGFYELALKVSQSHKNDSEVVIAKVEAAWNKVYPDLLIEYQFLDEEVKGRYEFESIMAKSIGFFVVIALIISILGLYGLTDYLSNVKKKEIGIRKVVGADLGEILLLFVKEVAALLSIAFVISSTGGYLLMNGWLEGFEYRVSIGWQVFAFSFLATAIVTFLTMGSRTFTAARLNPVEILKEE